MCIRDSTQARQLIDSVAVFRLAEGASSTPAAVAHAVAAPPVRTPAPAAKPVVASKPSAPLVERRGPNRAKNVVRPSFGAKTEAASVKPAAALPPDRLAAPAATGTDDDWESF